MSLFRRKKSIPFESYQLRTPLKKNTPDSTIRWAVLDLEATGFDVVRDRILSIAVAIIENGEFHMGAFKNWYVYQSTHEVNEATKVHGILPSQIEEGIPEKQMLEALIPILEGVVIVGHHVRFDVTMLEIALKRHFSMNIKNQVVDTAYFASKELDAFQRTGYSNQPLPSMEDVCAQLSIPMAERHTAEGDVFTTAQLFLILRGRLKMRLQQELLLSDYPFLDINRALRPGKRFWSLNNLRRAMNQILDIMSQPSPR